MKNRTAKSALQLANAALQSRDFFGAITLYERVKTENPLLSSIANQNIEFCNAEIIKAKLSTNEPLTPEAKINAKIKAIESATELTKKEQIAVPASKARPIQNLYAPLPYELDSQKPKNKLKTAVIINATNSDPATIKYILNKVKNIKSDNHVFLLLSANNRDLIHDTELLLNAVSILETASTGSPLLTLASCARTILTSKFDTVYIAQVLNYHASRNLSEEKVFDFAASQTHQLLGSAQTVDKILHTFETQPAVGFIGAADAYKSARLSPAHYSPTIATLAQSFDSNVDPAQTYGYFSGGSFWTRPDLLLKFSDLILNCELTHIGLQQAELCYELIIGLIAHHSGCETALLYPTSLDNTHAELVLAKNTLIPNGSNYAIGTSFKSYEMLEADSHLLDNSPSFSSTFYRRHYPYLSNLKMFSIYHFLRFGFQEGFNPNPDFSVHWYRESNNLDVEEQSYNPLIHHIKHPDRNNIVFPAQENLTKIMEIIGSLSLFDESFYLENNPDVAKSKMRPLFHYCKYGWQELRLPSASAIFDAIWYESEYLTNWNIGVNPLLHYALCHENLSLAKRPTFSNLKKGFKHANPNKIKRICLFAGYDSQSIIDEYVVKLITELSLYSDVYYLADCEMPPQELNKLQAITKNAWAFRHGEYDFGSYTRLALNLVGWDKLQKYDEVLLVNDSGYLLSSLEPVFKKMDNKPCDWWGLQATKGIAATRTAGSNQYTSKIPMSKVLNQMLPSYELDDCYDFLIGSYFLSFRKPTLGVGGVFNLLLKSVRKERNKRNVVLRYEVGLTRRMLLAGHKPATFIDDLYPFHPIFTDNHFKLIAEGFPLFKRYLLTENHYKVADLSNWKQRIYKILPLADLDAAEKNLWRVCSSEKLYATLNVPLDGSEWPLPLLTNEEFVKEDLAYQKDERCWAFPVCAFDHLFGGNERMVFEAVKNDPSIKKVILTRNKKINVDGVNVHIAPLKSRHGQQFLIESRYLFIKHTPWRNTVYPLNPELHRFINLWHGIPLKRIGYTSLDMAGNLEASAKEHDKCHAVIASSKIDRLAMAAAFYPLSFHDVWVTGLPRNDVILRSEELLPEDFKLQIKNLRKSLGDRKLVLFAPTFRNGHGESCYQFSGVDINMIAECMLKHNAVLGVREHMAAKEQSYYKMFSNSPIPMLDLGRANYADIELIYREASLLITDYSSCFIDFMLTGKPEICFAYDYERYAGSERGLFYELKDVFPGPVCDNAASLVSHIDKCLSGLTIEPSSLYEIKRRTFFDYIDDKNTSRVIERITSDIMDRVPSRSLRNLREPDNQGV